MNEAPENNQSPPNPEKTKVKDRINAVFLTLYANPLLAADTAVAAGGAPVGLAYSDIVKSDSVIGSIFKMADESMPLIPDGAKPIVAGAMATLTGLFGRASLQPTRELLSSNPERQTPTPKDFASSVYNDSMIPYLTRAWQTGLIQIRETKPKKESPKLSVKEKAKKFYRNIIKIKPKGPQ